MTRVKVELCASMRNVALGVMIFFFSTWLLVFRIHWVFSFNELVNCFIGWVNIYASEILLKWVEILETSRVGLIKNF